MRLWGEKLRRDYRSVRSGPERSSELVGQLNGADQLLVPFDRERIRHSSEVIADVARVLGWGVREGKAMIATLRHRLVRVPARLTRHAGALILRLPPDHQLRTEVLTRLRALPITS